MNVLLDTNTLNLGLKSSQMRSLNRLSQKGKINLVIPDLVKNEFVSRKYHDVVEYAQEIKRNIKRIKKIIDIGKSGFEEFAALEKCIPACKDRVRSTIEENFKSYISDGNITLEKFRYAEMEDVLENYFYGGGVFSKPKAREDLPDAMISTVIKRIAQDSDSLFVITNDKKFIGYLGTLQGVCVFSNLQMFFEQEDIKSLINELDAEEESIEAIKLLLSDNIVQKHIKNYIFSADSQLEDMYLEEESIVFEPGGEIEISHWAPSITGMALETLQNLVLKDVSYIGSRTYTLKVSFKCQVGLSYAAWYGEYFNLPDDRKGLISMDNMKGSGACELSEWRSASCVGVFEIQVDTETDPEALRELIEQLQEDGNRLQVEMVVEEVRLV